MINVSSHPSPLIGSNRIDRRPPTALDTPELAALFPTPSGISIGPIIVRTIIVVLAVAGGIVLALILGVLLGFIPFVVC
jgi:hypothetical protein